MLDPKLLRNEFATVQAALAKRHVHLDAELWSALEQRRRELQIETEQLQSERNTGSKQIGIARKNGENTDALMAAMADINKRLVDVERASNAIQQEWQGLALSVPNLPDDSVPAGKGEEDNVEVRRVGDVKEHGFEAKDHIALGETLGMSFERAS
ncbi:MAG: serine--tRNA ligase, partial [Moraxellaceae bacterium]|nr:serine--tRNA ligase [Moraxellaceae bacterium]